MSNSFFSYGAEYRLGKGNQLLKLSKVVDWRSIRIALKGLRKYEEEDKGGARGDDGLKMFKAILLWQWHSLSDSEDRCKTAQKLYLMEQFLKKQWQWHLTIYVIARDARLKSIKLSSKKLLFTSRNSYNALLYSHFS